MSKDNSGPAFPAMSWDREGEFLGANNGMTLRDYFAAKAMQGWLSSYPTDMEAEIASNGAYVIAAFSYQVADAMLKERAK